MHRAPRLPSPLSLGMSTVKILTKRACNAALTPGVDSPQAVQPWDRSFAAAGCSVPRDCEVSSAKSLLTANCKSDARTRHALWHVAFRMQLSVVVHARFICSLPACSA